MNLAAPARLALRLLAVFSAAAALAQSASAQTASSSFPSRPLRMLVTFPPGGSTDIVGRIVSPLLAERLGKPVVVENRPGASGAIAAEVVAKAPPDGHALLIAGTSSVLGLNVVLIPNLPYHPKELTPITGLVTSPFVVAVNTSMLPASTIRELIALLKAKPRQPFASGGNVSGMHLAGELFRSMSGADMFHVPYKGNGPAMADLSGGQVPIAFVDLGSTGPYLKSTRVKVLAVASKQRFPTAPDIPTTAESGLPGWEALGSFGLVTTAGTPRDVIMKLNAEVTSILRLPDVRERILATNNEPFPTSPEEYGEFVRSEVAKWSKVIKEANIKLD